MFTFQTCAALPEHGGRGYGGGGVVEVEGRVVWGGGLGGVYRFDEVSSEWVKLAGGEMWATLAECRGELVYVPLNVVQIFDGRTWHMGPPLPRPCYDMSAVLHGDLVCVVGGWGMERAVWSATITDLVSH